MQEDLKTGEAKLKEVKDAVGAVIAVTGIVDAEPARNATGTWAASEAVVKMKWTWNNLLTMKIQL